MAIKKDYSQLKITHEFECGTTMSNEQFTERRITVKEENNQEEKQKGVKKWNN